MIQLLGIAEEPISIAAEYIPEIENYDITSAYLTDEFRGRRYLIGTQIMLWLDPEDRFAEIETICPLHTDLPRCPTAPTLTTTVGIPRLQVLSGNHLVYVQQQDDGFTLWLVQGKPIDRRIDTHDDTVSFLFAGNELVGISAHRATVVR